MYWSISVCIFMSWSVLGSNGSENKRRVFMMNRYEQKPFFIRIMLRTSKLFHQTFQNRPNELFRWNRRVSFKCVLVNERGYLDDVNAPRLVERNGRYSHRRECINVEPRFGGHNIGASRTEEKAKILQYDQLSRALVGTAPALSTHCSVEPHCMTMLRGSRW